MFRPVCCSRDSWMTCAILHCTYRLQQCKAMSLIMIEHCLENLYITIVNGVFFHFLFNTWRMYFFDKSSSFWWKYSFSFLLNLNMVFKVKNVYLWVIHKYIISRCFFHFFFNLGFNGYFYMKPFGEKQDSYKILNFITL